MSDAESTVAPSSTKSSAAKYRRRWFQFSLRSLAIFMVVCSVLLGGFGWRLQRARKQARAISTIISQGGTISYDFAMHKDENGMYEMNTKSSSSAIPAFLRKLLGDDFFHDVYGVHHAGSPPATQQDLNAAWDAIGTFPHLKALQIARGGKNHAPSHSPGITNLAKTIELQHLLVDNGKVDAKDLRVVGKLHHLHELKGWGVDFDDAALASLTELNELRILDTSASQASIEGANAISRLQNLEELQLSASKFGDAEAVSLKGLSKLKRLTLSKSQIGNEGLKSIAQLQNLECIDLPDAPIGDDGMDYLAQLPKLYYVNIIRTKITNASLRKLGRAKSITHLFVDQTAIDDDGLAALGDFPKLTDFYINWNPITDRGLSKASFPPTLKRLGLLKSRVTDEGLKYLAAQSALQSVDVQLSEVTGTGATELMKAVPGCKVMFTPPKAKTK